MTEALSRRARLLARAALALSLCFGALPAGAAGVLVFPASIESDLGESAASAAAFGEALRGAFMRGLARAGFEPRDDGASEAKSPPEMAREARDAGLGWFGALHLYLEGNRLSYWLAIFEAQEGGLIAYSSFSAYAGIGAIPFMDESARAVATEASSFRDLGPSGRAAPILPYRIRVESRDEGAEVSLGDGKSDALNAVGRIQDGSLTLPYYALEKGSRVQIVLSAPGKRSLSTSAIAQDEALVFHFPRMRDIERDTLYLDTGPGRLLGLGLGYRHFLDPDRFFFFVEGKAFAGFDFRPGSYPLLHSELWQGLGAYVFSRPDSALRWGICAGGGELFSSFAAISEDGRGYFDLALVPLEAFAECSLAGGWSLRVSARAAYSLGLQTGIVARGWMGSPLALLMSCGVSWSLR